MPLACANGDGCVVHAKEVELVGGGITAVISASFTRARVAETAGLLHLVDCFPLGAMLYNTGEISNQTVQKQFWLNCKEPPDLGQDDLVRLFTQPP